jgi:hypothetical protein
MTAHTGVAVYTNLTDAPDARLLQQSGDLCYYLVSGPNHPIMFLLMLTCFNLQVSG